MPFGGKEFVDRPDVNVIHWGFRYTVNLTGSLVVNGWRGGTFTKFVDNWTVDLGGPVDYAGFLHRSSAFEEGSQTLISRDPERTGVSTIVRAGAYDFLFYETQSVNARRAAVGQPPLPGPALPAGPLTYTYNAPLYVSSNGLLTSEQEVSGANPVGIVTSLPPSNQGYLGVIL